MKRNNIYKVLAIVNLLLVLALFHSQVNRKEETIKTGKTVYFSLAPRDPRSLMQGDYMALNYELINSVRWDEKFKQQKSPRGYCIVTLNDSSVASLQRLQPDLQPLAPGEVPVKYFTHGSSISIGAESYFFEESTGDAYTIARYGGLKVDDKGNSILTGLYNKTFKKLEAKDSVWVIE